MKEMNSFTKRKAENGGECVLTESELTFDKKFKQLFLKKEFLAPILKNVVLEYKDCALEEIEGYITTHGDQNVNPELYSSEDAGKRARSPGWGRGQHPGRACIPGPIPRRASFSGRRTSCRQTPQTIP